MAYFLGPGTVGRSVLWQGTVAHAQARVHNVDIKHNHAYYTALYNREIQECGRLFTTKMTQNKPQISPLRKTAGD